MKNTLCSAVLLLCCASFSSAQSERSLLREGNRQYSHEKFADAEVNYRKALEKNTEASQGAFNLGDALYKQGRFDEAAGQYRIAAEKQKDPIVKAQSYHNLGNALLKAGKIPESIGAYQNSLKLNPKDLDTKYNLEYAKALLQQQQQQKKQDQKEDKKKDQKQDQQKQDQKKQDQQKQDQQKQDQQKRQQEQQKKQQISKQDAARILEALQNEEKDVQKKLKKKVPARIRVEKNW